MHHCDVCLCYGIWTGTTVFKELRLDSSAESGGLATGLVKEGAGVVSDNAVIASCWCHLLLFIRTYIEKKQAFPATVMVHQGFF